MKETEPGLLDEMEAALSASAAAPPRARVLIADDHGDYRSVIAYLLKSHEYAVYEAYDGESALNLAIENLPDLVVADFNMPKLNGYELLTELRARAETREIPVIILTGASNRKNIEELLTTQAAYFEKPVPNAVLLAAIAKMLAGRPRREVPVLKPETAPAAELGLIEEKEEADDSAGLETMADDSPVINEINGILLRAVETGASDIHIEPKAGGVLVRLRLNGVLSPLRTASRALAARMAARIKIMADLVITERRLPQDGQIRARVAGKKVEFRVSTVPGVHGEKVVIRVLGGSKIPENVDKLGLSARDAAAARQALASPHGLILVTGPTGSGKTTTLYSMLKTVAVPGVNVVTAEDPVEYELPEATQVQVKPAIGLTFESALRAFLRQDPDVMLVGEIRDLVTAEIAVKAAITGHQVFSTVHTNSAPATASRLAHMGLPPYLIASALKLVVAQRLVRTLCRCKRPASPTREQLEMLSPEEAPLIKDLFEPGSCRDCHETGFSGRRPLFEVMPVRTPEMRQRLGHPQDSEPLAALAVAEGMTPLRRAAFSCALAGETSLSEALEIMMGE